MTFRKPLVLDGNAEIQQLQSTDDLDFTNMQTQQQTTYLLDLIRRLMKIMYNSGTTQTILLASDPVLMNELENALEVTS
jgi:hypothetical protein